VKQAFFFFLVIALFINCNDERPLGVSPNKILVFDEDEKSDSITLDSLVITAGDTVNNDGWKRIVQFEVKDRLRDYGKENKETRFKIVTTYGEIKVKLYNSTPLHRSSMILMIKEGIFENTSFYRVTNDFIIQAGFTDGPGAYERIAKIGRYKIPP